MHKKGHGNYIVDHGIVFFNFCGNPAPKNNLKWKSLPQKLRGIWVNFLLLLSQDGEESQKDKDEKEELDFMFDEEIDSFGGGGRKNNFSEWLVAFLVLLKYPGPEIIKKTLSYSFYLSIVFHLLWSNLS